jgi:hypothetical protein
VEAKVRYSTIIQSDCKPTNVIVLQQPLVTATTATLESINTMKSKKNGGFPDRGLDSQALHLLGDLMEKDAEGAIYQNEEIPTFTNNSKVSEA